MTNPNQYTIDDVLACEQCWSEEKVRSTWPGSRRTITSRDILDDERIDDEDTGWILIQLLPVPQLQLYMCWFAEQRHEALPETKRDSRLLPAIAVIRRHLAGDATDDELKVVRKSLVKMRNRLGVMEDEIWTAWKASNPVDCYDVWGVFTDVENLPYESSLAELVRLHESLEADVEETARSTVL